MRVRKFRAFSKGPTYQGFKKGMNYSDNYENLSDFFSYWEAEKDAPLLDYTGLKDKNGKEIYEGDICTNPVYLDKLTVVFGDEEGCGFHYSFHYANDAVLGRYDWEVIGNIYKNPKLLEKE